MKIKEGQIAPNFTLPNQDGENISLGGGWTLIYFYPKDDTPGCTTEAKKIRDAYNRFKKKGITVLGISKDSVKSHKKFKEKYKLPFDILSDEDKKVIKLYGSWKKKKFMGREYMGINRNSFLVNPKGKIEKIYENVKPALHADEVLGDVK